MQYRKREDLLRDVSELRDELELLKAENAALRQAQKAPPEGSRTTGPAISKGAMTKIREAVVRSSYEEMSPDDYFKSQTCNTDPVWVGPVPLDRYGNCKDPAWIKDDENQQWIHIDPSEHGEGSEPKVIEVVPYYKPSAYTR